MSVKYTFHCEESRIYDFLRFPQFIFYDQINEDSGDKNNYADLVDEDYSNFCGIVQAKLAQYKKEIEQFYMNKFYFPMCFFRFVPFLDYNSEEDYLNKLLQLDDYEITKCIAYDLIKVQSNKPYSDENVDLAEEMSKDKSRLIQLIKDSPIDSGEKWYLYCIMEEPKKSLDQFVGLMLKLLPMFKEIYSDYADRVKVYGEYLINKFSEKGKNALKEMTCNLLDTNKINASHIKIIISAFFAHDLELAMNNNAPYIRWGLKMEQTFEKIKEINEDKLNQRVLVFKNLGDKTRYEVLKLISQGQISQKEIADILGVSGATISYHINNLVTSKIIKLDVDNNKYGYLVNYELLEDCFKSLKEDILFPLS